MPILINNKRAKFDYEILESFQAGLELSSRMVKAIRSKLLTLDSKYIVYQNGKLEILDIGTAEWKENIPLLLNKREINEIEESIKTKGISCIPLNFKTVGRWLKAEIALVKGKKQFNKKEVIKGRDIERDMQRNLADFKG